ncbi:uncharacterized protein LOC116296195 [Actinia tenebrosa]|uniref:Uncharacterized protein LOC116296195 n=1 Tax=Actinia tenebrosa TaxID=6105 RepID=A0A6P8I5M2_ACTTE|nr:uncharacterized protein LOC116296195 [Actinia tenebrosa]
MKGSVFLVVILACYVALSYASTEEEHPIKEKRFLLDTCSTDADCGKNRCCIKYLSVCAPKRGLEQSCNFKDYHGCGCEDGLYCQVAKCFASYKYYRCLPEA